MGLSSKFWKLDKIDKIGILIILVFFTLFSIFNCFSYASESVPLSEVKGAYVVLNSDSFVAGANPNFGTSYASVEKGYRYTITTSEEAASVYVAFGDVVPAVGQPYYDVKGIGGRGSTYVFDVTEDFEYMYIYGSWSTFFTVTREPIPGFDSAIKSLVDNVGFNQLWSTFEISIPYIFIVLIIAIGFYFIFHAIREMSKGRDI